MPQMAPISWLILFFVFSITFVIFNILNYYNYSPTLLKSNILTQKMNYSIMNWKW